MIQWIAAWIAHIYRILLMTVLVALQVGVSHASDFEQRITQASFDEKQQLMTQWYQNDSATAGQVAAAMLAGRLYFDKRDDQLYLIDNHRKGESAVSFSSGETRTIDKKRSFKRVSVNNALRDFLNSQLALEQLSAPDPDQRIAAVEQLASDPTDTSIRLIAQARATEQNTQVIAAMDLALAISLLESTKQADQRWAVDHLADSLSTDALNAYGRLITPKPTSTPPFNLQSPKLKIVGASSKRLKHYILG